MKAIILLVMHLICIIRLTAQSEGPHSPATFSNISIPGYNQQWTNTANTEFSDNNYASFGDLTGGAGSHTDYLVATNFGFNIPSGTTIMGVEVEVECSDPNYLTSDYSVRLVRNGVIVGDDKAQANPYWTTDKYMIYGGYEDRWNVPWTYTHINNAGFGVAIAAQRNADSPTPTAGQINSIRIIVYYRDLTLLPVSLASFSATKAGTAVRLNWKTSSETNMDRYEIERSSNGTNFNPITSIPSLNNTSATEYHYTDNNPLSGISYYRLNMKELGGDQKYSHIVAVSFVKNNAAFLYPSPWEKGTNLHISNMNSEKLTIWFMNAGGQILSTAITESGLVPTETLANRKGMIYFKVFDKAKNLVGAGGLLIQ